MPGLIGALRVSLSADTAAFHKGMTGAERKAATSANSIQKSLGGVRTGMIGLVAGLSLGALVAAGKRALDYAASLGEVSQQLGVTTRDLQVYRYIAGQVGISQDEMDKGLSSLTVTMGKARDGAAEPVKVFKELSKVLGRDILQGAKTAGDAIPLIADAMAKIEDPTRRAQLEMALFGKTGQKFDTLLAAGSEAIYELARAAEELGIVLSDEQIANADKTADKLEAVKMVLEARIAGVVSENAGAIIALVDALGQLVVWAGKAALAWQDFVLAQGQKIAQGQADSWWSSDAERMAALQTVQAIADKRFKLSQTYAGGGGSAAPRAGRPVGGGGGGAGAGSRPGRKKKGGGRDDSERKRKEALRDEYQFATEQRRNQIDILRAQQDLAHDYSERTSLEVAILDLEREQERASNVLNVALGDMTQAQADTLGKQLDILDTLKRQKVLEEEQEDRRRDVAAVEDARSDIQRDRLEAEADLAETAAERRDVEMRILKAAYQEERAKLERIMAESKDDTEREIARQQLGALHDRQAMEAASIRQGTRGPLEEFLASLPTTAAKANEALEAVAANGLESLTDGLTEAIMGAKSLGDVFSSVAKQIIADLLKIAIQRAIIAPLAGLLGGAMGGGGGISGALQKAGGGIGGGLPKGFARGGSFMVAGRGGTDRNILSVNGMAVARVGRGERVNVSPNSGPGGGVVVNQHFAPNFAGNAATREDLAMMGHIAKSETIRAIRDLRSRGAL